MKPHFQLVAFVVLLLPSTVLSEDYEVQLTRPDRVGEKNRIISTFKRVQKFVISKDGKAIDTKRKTVAGELQAVIETQKVDKRNQATKVALTIERLVDGKGNTLLKKGMVVVAQTLEKETVFRQDGEPLPEDVEEVLQGLVSTAKPGTSDDDVFGTKKRRKVGDSWKINVAAAIKSAAEERIKVSKVSGSVTLAGVKKVAGMNCLELRAKMSMQMASFPQGVEFEKQGFQYERGELKGQMSGLYPVDVKQHSASGRMLTTVSLRFTGNEAGTKGLTIDLTLESTRVHKLVEPVK